MPHTNIDNIVSAYIIIISSRAHADADAHRREIVRYFLVFMFVTDFSDFCVRRLDNFCDYPSSNTDVTDFLQPMPFDRLKLGTSRILKTFRPISKLLLPSYLV